MTQEIIEMPEYLNASYEGDDLYTGDQVRELMKLVADKEREACSERAWIALVKHKQPWNVRQDVTDAIRARGEA